MSTLEISNKKGFRTRDEYLQSLVLMFGFKIEFITELANAYDESEDFDGFISALYLYSGKEQIDFETLEDVSPKNPVVEYN